MEPPYVGCYANYLEPLYLWLPPFAISSTPKCGRGFVSDDFVLFAVEVDGMTGAPRDIAQMTEKRALLAIFDFGLQFLARPYCFNKIAEMQNVVVLAFDLTDDLVVQIV